MAFTYGFYNSRAGDRKYDAVQMSRIFDGIINNGVYMSIGTCFMVKAYSGMIVNVGVGRAWFDHTWSHNDSIMPIEINESELILDRIDTIVLDIQDGEDHRENKIMVVQGLGGETPTPPELIQEEYHHQYPLADIYVSASTEEITQADIANRVGTEDTPFVTGIIDVMHIDDIVAQWQSEWEIYIAKSLRDTSEWIAKEKEDLGNYEDEFEAEMRSWKVATKMDFDEWFENLQYEMTQDVALNLQNQIRILNQKDFERYYGMVDKSTRVNKDSQGNTLSIVETTSEATATTTFEDKEIGKVITTILIPEEGVWNYEKIVTISQDVNDKVISEIYERKSKNPY